MHSRFVVWSALLVALAPLACGGGDGLSDRTFDLTFRGTGFDSHEGEELHVALVHTGVGVLAREVVVVQAGAFELSFPGLLEADQDYSVDFYADENENGECEPTDDHVYRLTLSGVDGDELLETDHLLPFAAEACASFADEARKFDLTFEGSGFGPHEGQTVFAALVRADRGEVVASGSDAVAGGAFRVLLPGELEPGHDYRVDYYADVDGDGACADGADHVWEAAVPAFDGDALLGVTHSLDFRPEACASF
ncbi:MAG TPA: hypothetical protein PK668_21410 [Myxococcota bacterium]|nr:hypothetical protein [Myxococcota bacterium]HRY96035.1 hypothetical protein [Myxococcota bacterium]HSA21427.1 hypothetical protein [Myxococcota bacterium]